MPTLEDRNIDHIFVRAFVSVCVCVRVENVYLFWSFSCLKWEGDTTVDRFVPTMLDS